MKKQIFVLASVLASSTMVFAGVAFAQMGDPGVPTSPDQCKQEGWRSYGDMFKNQGDCVSFVVTNGTNPPDGPPIN